MAESGCRDADDFTGLADARAQAAMPAELPGDITRGHVLDSALKVARRSAMVQGYIAVVLTVIALQLGYVCATLVYQRPVTQAELKALAEAGKDEQFYLRRSMIPLVRVDGSVDVNVENTVDVNVER